MSPANRSPISVTTTVGVGRRVEQRDRQAELVVVRLGARVAAERREHRGEQILGRGLAGRSGHADDAEIRTRAGRARGRPPADARSVSSTCTIARAGRRHDRSGAARHERDLRAGARTRRRRSRDRRDRPRSATKHAPGSSARESKAHDGDRRVGRSGDDGAAGVARDLGRGRSRARLQLGAGDERGRRTAVVTPSAVWPVSWPLPATTTTSPARAPAIAARIAARAVEHRDRRPSTGGNAGEDLVDDRGGILGAGVVGGHVRAIGEPGRDLTHQRPLGAIAIAAAAEHHDHARRRARRARVRPRARCRARRACARSRRAR